MDQTLEIINRKGKIRMEKKEKFDVPEGFDTVKEGVTYGELVEITYDSGTTGTTRKANIILPPDYDENKKYPVLYLLHGIGGDHNEWLGAQPVNVISNLVAAGEAVPMITVIPNVRARADDAVNPQDIYTLEHYKAFDNFINDLRDDLMPYIEANYSILKGKENTAIAGLSMGGRETLFVGCSMPETFGYMGAFTPAPGLLPAAASHTKSHPVRFLSFRRELRRITKPTTSTRGIIFGSVLRII